MMMFQNDENMRSSWSKLSWNIIDIIKITMFNEKKSVEELFFFISWMYRIYTKKIVKMFHELCKFFMAVFWDV